MYVMYGYDHGNYYSIVSLHMHLSIHIYHIYMYGYIYIHIYLYIYIYIYIYVHIYIYKHTYRYTHTYVYKNNIVPIQSPEYPPEVQPPKMTILLLAGAPSLSSKNLGESTDSSLLDIFLDGVDSEFEGEENSGVPRKSV
jgi:hypothetical protein